MGERKGKEMGEYLILDDLADGLNRRDLSEYMNPPEPHNGQAYIQRDYKTGKEWICCPHCGKRQFPLSDGAEIKNQEFQCKGSNCKKIFHVDTGEGK